MKAKLLFALGFILLHSAFILSAFAQGTAFTYQGRLNTSGAAANGTYDFRFRLAADSLGNSYVGSAALVNGVAVTNGLFTATIDFGAGIFTGANYWLEVDVRTNGAGDYTTLTPLQSLTSTPYAVMAGSASNLLGTLPTAQITGTLPVAQLSGTLPDAQLSANVALRAGGNTFSRQQTFNGQIRLDTTDGYSQSASGNFSIDAPFFAGGRFMVLTNGNVGVGKNNPATALDVNGTVTATSFAGNGAGLTNIPAAAITTPPPGMALIPAGTFTMGDNLDGEADAMPPTNVYVSAFYMDVNLVSYSQWQSVYFWATNAGYAFTNAGAGKAANHPVQTVDWYDCVKWCNARSQQAGRTPVYYTDAGFTQVYTNGETDAVYPNWPANGYRLPTEAEWEKAARGGLSGQRFPWGNIITENLANYYGDTVDLNFDLGPNGYNGAFTNGVSPYTSPVGYFAPNGYGLSDKSGSLYEWCWDWYKTPYAGGSDPHGPTGPLSYRILRGGSWYNYASHTRCAYRNYDSPSDSVNQIGFRCVRGL